MTTCGRIYGILHDTFRTGYVNLIMHTVLFILTPCVIFLSGGNSGQSVDSGRGWDRRNTIPAVSVCY